MVRPKLSVFFIVLFASLLPLNSIAAENLSLEKSEDVKNIENYINSIKYLSASFVQSSSDGAVLEGNFYLNRPDKLRVEYNSPSNVLIIANSGTLMYYDKELDEVSNIKTKSTPLYVLTKEPFSLHDNDIQIKDLIQDNKNIKVSAIKKDEEEIGQISFIFDKDPIKLIKIETIDGFNNSVEVFFYNIETNEKLDSSLFKLKNPHL